MKRLAVVLALSTAAWSANPGPVTAQEDVVQPATLHVSGQASVQRVPDIAVVELAVETLAESAAEATEQNGARMAAVLRAIGDLGVSSSRIRTRRVELQPRYETYRDREGPPAIVGYMALNQVSIRLDDVERTGPVVDAGIRAGANRVSGIRFELADPREAYYQALRQAIADALSEAAVAATALGMRLGEPVQVTTGGFRPMMPGPRFEMAAMRADAGTPVEPGEIAVEATVSIVWRLES